MATGAVQPSSLAPEVDRENNERYEVGIVTDLVALRGQRAAPRGGSRRVEMVSVPGGAVKPQSKASTTSSSLPPSGGARSRSGRRS